MGQSTNLNRKNVLPHVIQTYGDLLYTTCTTLLWAESLSQTGFRLTLRNIKKSVRHNQFEKYEKLWILRELTSTLRTLARRYDDHLVLTDSEIAGERNLNPDEKLQNLVFYFRKLTIDDQFLILYRDCFEFDFAEISSALEIPQGSLEIRHSQILRMIHEWIWEGDLSEEERTKSFPQIQSLFKKFAEALPESVKKDPLHANLPFEQTTSYAPLRHSRWTRAPWFVRSSVEGIGIAAIILITVATVPKIRNFYEKSVERRMQPFDLHELARDLAEKPEGARSVAQSDESEANTEDQYTGEELLQEGEADNLGEDEEIHVGNSEIWRFNLKTDDPHEMKKQVQTTLVGMGVPEELPELEGRVAPGGIQFDILVRTGIVWGLKKKLQKMARPIAANETIRRRRWRRLAQTQNPDDKQIQETFTWFKNKQRRRLPQGRTRVVIWLSQI